MLKKSINIRTFEVEIEINSNREIAPMTSLAQVLLKHFCAFVWFFPNRQLRHS